MPLRSAFLLPLGLSCAAFVVDLMTPQGMIDGFLYVFAVLACIWVPCVTAAIYTALGLMPLMAIGFALSPPGAPMPLVLVNQLGGVGTLWIAAMVVWQRALASREREAMLMQIRNLQTRSANAANAERIELSRWLHEGIGQELAAVGWGLDSIARRAENQEDVRTQARELRALIDNALTSLRGRAAFLRNFHMDSRGLQALIENHVQGFSARTDIPVQVNGFENLRSVPDRHSDLCFRVVQEALTNVAKHSGARRAAIEFRTADNSVSAIVIDDGRGISEVERIKPDSLGLLGLRERLVAIGGELIVSNISPHGVRVEAQIPLA